MPVRIVTPWNGSRVSAARPTFRILPASAAVHVDICSDRACTVIRTSITGPSPLTPSVDLPRGRWYARARPESGGPWSATFAFFVEGTGGNAMWMDAPDFNGDGFDDAVVIQRLFTAGGNRALVVAGSSTGPSATPMLTFRFPDSSFASEEARAAGDVDGDGFVDLVHFSGSAVELHRGSATGLLVPTRVAFTDAGGTARFSGPTWAPVGDVDGDGYADLVTYADLRIGEFADIDVVWMRGGPSGFDGVLRPLDTAPFGALQPFLGGFDSNGDGFGELIAEKHLHLGGASGPATARAASLPLCTFPQSVGDNNRDGTVDVFTEGAMSGASCEQRTWTAFSGVGLTPTVWFAFGSYASDVGDTNGDGATDAVLVELRPGTQGAGDYVLGGTSTVVDLGVVPSRFVTVGDANGDGFADATYTAGETDLLWIPGSASGLVRSTGRTLTIPL